MFEWFLHKTRRGDIAINACNSTPDSVAGGWLRKWIEYYGKHAMPQCSILSCPNMASVGGHIRLIRGSREYATIYVLPICKSCNNRQGRAPKGPPKMLLRGNVSLLHSNMHNFCRYRCRESCQFKQRRRSWYQRFFYRLFH